MAEMTLRDCRILVVEDEYYLADELRTELEDRGAVVLGPVGTLDQALALIAGTQDIDGAILDVNLRGEQVYPAADLLLSRAIPFVFATGYDAAAFPPRLGQIARCEKPVSVASLVSVIGGALSRG